MLTFDFDYTFDKLYENERERQKKEQAERD